MAVLLLTLWRSLSKGVAHTARQLTALSWACLLAALLLVLLLGTCSYHANKDAKRAVRDAEAHARNLKDKGKADEKASDERLWDFQINHNREKERTDAVTTSPDGPTSPVQRSLACVWLRDQSRRAEDIPAACRSDGRGKASG